MTDLITLPYTANSLNYFSKIQHWPYAVLLDSCHPLSQQGRFDIISACPFTTLTHEGQQTYIKTMDHTLQRSEDPLALLEEYLQAKQPRLDNLPFCGGALGFLSYDLAQRFERLPPLNANEFAVPEMIIGLYDWALIVDHQACRSTLVAQHRCPQTKALIAHLRTLWQAPFPRLTFKRCPVSLQADYPATTYHQGFERIKKHIVAGNCYQANLSQRFSGSFAGSSWDLYQQIRADNPAPFAAFLQYPEFSLLSVSPEQFLKVTDEQVITRPIKGTRPRHADPHTDQQLAQTLLNDAKEYAENVMIVDLLRNDLSKSCQAGSVQVPKLCNLESFSSVHHLVSTVIGTLQTDKTVFDLLRGCFPGGSITGAPKIRAMEIINEVEPHRRTIYCGSIIALSFDQQLHSNIMIRTLLHQPTHLYGWAGGAIVAESNCEAEYKECYAKIAGILTSLHA